MDSLKNLLPGALARIGLSEEAVSALALAKADEVIEELFGQEGADCLKAKKFSQGVLTIAATTSGWRSSFHLRVLEFQDCYFIRFTERKVKKVIVQ